MQKSILRNAEGKFESKRHRLWKYVAYIWVGVFVMAGVGFMVSNAVNYHLTHNYGLRFPLIVKVDRQSVFWSEKKGEPVIISPTPKSPEVVNADTTPEWYRELSDLEKKVCDRWGIYECKRAVAICRAESLGCNQIINGKTVTSPTNDIGAMQINRVHWDMSSPSYKPECDLSKITTEDGNIECGHLVWEGSGWIAWSTHNNGSADARLSAMRK